MDNALGATEGPAAVTVRCGPEPDRTASVRVVEDDGPGFTAEQRRRAFESFFTTKMHGTGPGLATCRRIVEAHGGRIRLDEPDRPGTRVASTLPRRRA